jgi:hypothetical protein
MSAARDALCNRALSFLGEPPARPFESPTGTTVRDRACQAHYEAARDEVFTHHRWDFATALFPIAKTTPQPTNKPADFPIAYNLPTDMLRFQDVLLEGGGRLEHFTIIGNTLWTNDDNLTGHIAYTTSSIEPAAMPPVARECVAYALAIRIAPIVTQNQNKTEQMRAHLAQAYIRAVTTDSRQTGSRENMDPLLLARASGSYRSRYRGFDR